jgi:hypothetical protein
MPEYKFTNKKAAERARKSEKRDGRITGPIRKNPNARKYHYKFASSRRRRR